MSATAEGCVVRADARVCHVDVGGEVRAFAPRGKLFEALSRDVKNPIAVGDRVRVSLQGDPPGIEEVLARRNSLSRVASSHDPREQVLCANVDQLFVVASLAQPRFSSNRVDRILAACRYEEIPALLILNKIDLDEHGEAQGIEATYRAAGVTALCTCATSGEGLDAVKELLAGRVSVFYGASGAGKSTLLNAVQPGLGLKVGRVSRYWEAGRHTTSASQMHRLASVEGAVIDTPGVRVFRPWGVNKAELRDLYPEFEPYRGECRYDDCSHDHEPDCAVFAAVERGEIAPMRYQSYVEILDELEPPPEDDAFVEPPEC